MVNFFFSITICPGFEYQLSINFIIIFENSSFYQIVYANICSTSIITISKVQIALKAIDENREGSLAEPESLWWNTVSLNILLNKHGLSKSRQQIKEMALFITLLETVTMLIENQIHLRLLAILLY